MERKYLYAYNGIKGWLGGIGFFQIGSKPVNTMLKQSAQGGELPKKYIWRNKGEDQYAIGQTFEDNPLELSNYLLVRTRERMFLHNKAQGKLTAGASVTSKAYEQITGKYWEQALG